MMSKPTTHHGHKKVIDHATPEQREARWAAHHIAHAARHGHAGKAAGPGSAQSWETLAQSRIKGKGRKGAPA